MPKDIWDKLQAVGAVATPLVVAVVGGVLAYQLQTTRLADERSRLEQELAVLRVEIASHMIPFLSSEEFTKTRVALETISALGDVDLAVRMAQVVRGEPAVAALKSLASHPQCPNDHPESLSDLLWELRSSVVIVEAGYDGLMCNGFVIGSGIVTSSDCRVASGDYSINLPGFLYPSEATESVYLSNEYPESEALILSFTDEGHPAIPMASSNVRPLRRTRLWPGALNEVVVVGYSRNGNWTTLVGQPEPNYSGGPSGRLVAMSIVSQSRDMLPGAPVITDDGIVVGVYLPDSEAPKFMDPRDLDWLTGGPSPYPSR